MLVKRFYLSNLIKTVNINVNDFEALIFKILNPPLEVCQGPLMGTSPLVENYCFSRFILVNWMFLTTYPRGQWVLC